MYLAILGNIKRESFHFCQCTILLLFAIVSIKDFFSKYDQICSFLRIFLYLLKKSLMKNCLSCAECIQKQPPEVLCKKSVFGNFTKFTGKHLGQSLFFNKVAGLRPTTLLKKRLWHRCFPMNFAKFLRTHFLENTFERLLLW